MFGDATTFSKTSTNHPSKRRGLRELALLRRGKACDEGVDAAQPAEELHEDAVAGLADGPLRVLAPRQELLEEDLRPREHRIQ